MINRFVILSFLIVCSGCGKLGVLFMPDPRLLVPAEFKFAKDKKVAILIDDFLAPLSQPSLKDDLAHEMSKILTNHKAVKPDMMVSYSRVKKNTITSPNGKKQSIREIGQKAGSDYVIYVNITEFNLQEDAENPLVQPYARAYVKVIKVSSGERVWPIERTGHGVEAKIRMSSEYASSADRTEWSEKLIKELALDISHLFYDYRQGKKW